MNRREMFSAFFGIPIAASFDKKDNFVTIERWDSNIRKWIRCRLIEIKKGQVFRKEDSFSPYVAKSDAKYNSAGIVEVMA